MIKTFRFFREADDRQELLTLTADSDDEMQDKLDAAWDEADRNERWDAVEDYDSKSVKHPGHAGMKAGLLAAVARKNPTPENIMKRDKARKELRIVRGKK